jgi:hypothetical protein
MIKILKRARLVALFPLVFVLYMLAIIFVIGPMMALAETIDEFKYRWHGGYGG